MSKIRAGTLNRRIVILRAGAPVDDGYTTKPGTRAEIGRRNASIMPETRSEKLQALGVRAERAIRVWLRFDSLSRTLSAKDAVQWEGQIYEIMGAPMEIGRREGIEFTAVAES